MLSLLNQSDVAPSMAGVPAEPVEGLYVHIPFCFHKCHYCDFYSITRQSPRRMSEFVDRILREADRWAELVNRRPGALKTVFFGGGTPSLLPLELMHRLLQQLRQRFDLSGVREWTVEVNPATADLEYLQMLRAGGVDRISFGAQSFDRNELAMLERHHEPADVAAGVELARRTGFERINLDLIYAIPGQKLASWDRSLECAISLQTLHLSCYGLTYEPNTPFAVRKRLGQFRAAEESLELQMLFHARRRLEEAGLPAYEISNYAAPGQECRHNLIYWNGGNYIGLGPSAASHVAGVRWKNRPHLGEWEQAIDADSAVSVSEIERLTPTQRAGELAMLQLRLSTGVRFDDFRQRTGLNARAIFSGVIERLQRQGLVEIDAAGFRITPAGLPVADGIAAEFLAPA